MYDYLASNKNVWYNVLLDWYKSKHYQKVTPEYDDILVVMKREILIQPVLAECTSSRGC